MATWGLHLRVAEELLKKNHTFDEESFVVGNIGPDCGVPNEDWSQFSPPTEISHWSEKGRKNIDAQGFYNTYLLSDLVDKKEWSFYWGYYVHLFTDIQWSQKITEKKESHIHYARLKTDSQFIWTIKKDWYDLDRVYLRDNPTSIFSRVFQHVESFPDYLDYYPKGAIMRQIKHITTFYQKPKENLDRSYEYLTMKEMDDFIFQVVGLIQNDLKQKMK